MGQLLTFDKRAILTGNFMHKVDPVAKADPLMGSLFGKPPAPPPIAPPTPMPTTDDAAVQKAKLAAIAAAQQRGGRASTILTDDKADKLG
jgi:hypothetical protein